MNKQQEKTNPTKMRKTMETRSAKRKKAIIFLATGQDDIDRISDLPDAILHRILLLLPIKTIAKTSVLSKRWRSIWSTLPDLDFTTIDARSISSRNIKTMKSSSLSLSSSSSSSPFHYSLCSNDGTDCIHQVLSLRDKQVSIRALRFCAPLSFSRLNALMRLAIRHHAHEIDVEVATNDYFNLPRCVISSQSLRVFKLKSSYPGFRLPPPSVIASGFQSLNSLSLSLVILYNQPCLMDLFTDPSFPLLKKLHLDACFGLKELKVSCRLLEEFTLENCFQLNGLDVSGSKLEKLRVTSCFDAYGDQSWVKIDSTKLRTLRWQYNAITNTNSLKNLICLQEASVGVFVLHQDTNFSKIRSLFTLLSGLAYTNCLALENHCIEILSSKNSFTRLVCPFHKLRSLELHTCFNRHNVHGLASLFKICPMLHTLILKIVNDAKFERRQWNKDLWDVSMSEVEQYWESQALDLNPFLNHLNVVEIDGFLECENEVSLAMFLLKHGKALQEMTLRSGCLCRDSLRREKIRSQMMGFSKASSNAKISFH